MAAPCPLLGDGITDDTLLHIARFIPTARDMLCLQLACPRFAAKSAQQQGGSGGSAGAAVDRGGGGAAVGGGAQRSGA